MSTAGARRKRTVRSSKNGAGVAIADAVPDVAQGEPASEGAPFEVVETQSEAPPAAAPEEDAGALPGEDGASGAAPIAAELDRARQRAIVESLIFVSERTVTAAQIARSIKIRAALVRELVGELMEEYRGRGIELIEVAGGYQFRSSPACAPYVREFVAQRPVRLTRAQLETLALIAYRQPITRPEIDEVRGVDSGSAMRVLLERGLIKMLGRKDEPGRPLLYGTSTQFLEFFGMRSLKDLPTLREFTELSDENRALFKRKIGDSVEDAEAELLAAEEALRAEEQAEHVSDEDLAELAREADAEGEGDDEVKTDVRGGEPEQERGQEEAEDHAQARDEDVDDDEDDEDDDLDDDEDDEDDDLDDDEDDEAAEGR